MDPQPAAFAENLRYEYDLGPASVVLDVGAYLGTFTRTISARYGCRVYAFEPVRAYHEAVRRLEGPSVRVFPFGLAATGRTATISVRGDGSNIFLPGEETEEIELRALGGVLDELGLVEVDLVKLNVEGCEYELLEQALATGLVGRFANIQVQFHELVPDAVARRERIREGLAETHRLTYDYPFVWESHERL